MDRIGDVLREVRNGGRLYFTKTRHVATSRVEAQFACARGACRRIFPGPQVHDRSVWPTLYLSWWARPWGTGATREEAAVTYLFSWV